MCEGKLTNTAATSQEGRLKKCCWQPITDLFPLSLPSTDRSTSCILSGLKKSFSFVGDSEGLRGPGAVASCMSEAARGEDQKEAHRLGGPEAVCCLSWPVLTLSLWSRAAQMWVQGSLCWFQVMRCWFTHSVLVVLTLYWSKQPLNIQQHDGQATSWTLSKSSIFSAHCVKTTLSSLCGFWWRCSLCHLNHH